MSYADLFDNTYDFRSWLQRQPEGAEVGECRAPGYCPLALFGEAATGFACHVIPSANYYVVLDGKATEHPLPPWAIRFGNLVDDQEDRQTISRELALLMLDTVEEEM